MGSLQKSTNLVRGVKKIFFSFFYFPLHVFPSLIKYKMVLHVLVLIVVPIGVFKGKISNTNSESI